MPFDITILTANRYLEPTKQNKWVIERERELQQALENNGLKVNRISWDDPTYDWQETKTGLIRSIWDCYERFDEFSPWLHNTAKQIQLINPFENVAWNMDKHYLLDLEKKGIPIVPTYIIEQGDTNSLESRIQRMGWDDVILKPTISASAMDTFRLKLSEAMVFEKTYQKLIAKQTMMIQPFQEQIQTKGEISHMVLGGKYSHAIRKVPKEGDFRVQTELGGVCTVHEASPDEIAFIERVIAVCTPMPVYARVDVMWDNADRLVLMELELVEPELWLHEVEGGVERFVEAVVEAI